MYNYIILLLIHENPIFPVFVPYSVLIGLVRANWVESLAFGQIFPIKTRNKGNWYNLYIETM